ncbi:MAG: acetyltransferase-like isoleucine patch superfamily enzyme [Colwellia sp.]|jgi:acetyltransferase-like isoleucine patch superfamily enzyme
MSTYTNNELQALGFSSLGENVHISRKASFYGAERISIGSHVRIDDFCVLSAGAQGIKIGSYVHIGVHGSIIGAGHIELSDYCNISGRVSIYSSTDDYSGEYMTNPLIDPEFTNTNHEPVFIGKHVIVGCGSTILPNVTIGEGVALGALSLVMDDLAPWATYVGQPVRFIKKRSQKLLDLEKKFLAKINSTQALL